MQMLLAIIRWELMSFLLTENYSPVFKLIDSYSVDYSVKKKGLSNKNIEKSSLVAGARLELTTFGL